MNSIACSTTLSHQALHQRHHLGADVSALARSSRVAHVQTGRQSARVCVEMTHKESSPRAMRKDESTMRRNFLASMALGASAFAMEPLPCEAGVIDALKETKRNNNAKFLVGPIRLSRQRMFTVLALTEGNSPQYDEARTALKKASLDCVEPAVGLAGYAKVRDVCTYGIVYKSVTQGPAAKNDPDSPQFKEATAALISVVTSLKNLDALLASSAAGDMEAPKLFSSNFSSTMTALDRFELAIQSCLGYEPSLDREI